MNLIDWNGLLYIGKWVIIGLFYFVLLVLLSGVYREMGGRVRAAKATPAIVYGRLKVLNPGRDSNVKAGLLLPLQPETRMGTAPDNDLVLGDPHISGHHARLRWDGNEWWLEDLNSKNGTYLNNQPVPPHEPARAKLGTKVMVGYMVFELME